MKNDKVFNNIKKTIKYIDSLFYLIILNKDYPFIFISTDVGGSPSFPAIEPKELSISLNNFKAIEQSNDMNSNYLIAFTDREDLF